MASRLLCIGVVAAGTLLLAVVTDGFSAVTTEGARRVSVSHSPRDLPDVPLVDHTGTAFSWRDFAGVPVLVEFIFTTCPDTCQKMSSDFKVLVREAASEPSSTVRFVSVTFDPEHDSIERLRSVAASYAADGQRWRFARIDDANALAATLEAFGVVAIPSPTRGFEHNTAIHGLDTAGRLARIADIDQGREMLQWAHARAR